MYIAEILREGAVAFTIERERPFGEEDCRDWPGDIIRSEGVDYGPWEPAPANPVTDVEIAAKALATRRQTREDVIFSDTAGLVATCYAWLQRECAVPGGGTDTKTASQALQAGQGLCSPTSGHGSALRAWIDFAAPDFFQAMSSADESRPWLEWVPAGEPKSIREAILDRVYLATYGVPRT